MSNQIESINPPIDFAILTAIEVERLAICKEFGLNDKDRIQKDSRIYWRGNVQLKNGGTYEIVVAQSPDMANIDAALLTSDTLHHWHPRAAIMVGIAASASSNLDLGDVVVGSHIYYYERGKVTSSGVKPEPYLYPADSTLWASVAALPPWKGKIYASRPDKKKVRPKLHRGVIASGEKVIANAQTRNEIASAHRKILAIEMEGYGFAKTVWQSFHQVRHLVIRAICDNGSSSKNDEWHSYAAAAAASFAKHFLTDTPLTTSNTVPFNTHKAKLKGLINLQREKNDYFVEQSNIFARIDAELKAHHLAYLHGTHGLGKTTTLNEYAYSREKAYDFVIYILATESAIENEMARVADVFLDDFTGNDTPARKASKLKAYLEENTHWAKENKNWLIIFDNLESNKRIPQYFPITSKGDCLYACNEKLFISNNREVAFEQFSQEEAELFIFQKINKNPQAKYQDITPGNLVEIQKLIKQLGRLPLALNISTAYLIETEASIDDYIELIKANVRKFLNYKDEHREYHSETVFAAFMVTLDKISRFKSNDSDGEIVGKLAETFLNLLIFCAPEDIPEELIKNTLFKIIDISETITPQNILFRETIALLKRYGLIREKTKTFKYKEKFDKPETLMDGRTVYWEEKEAINKFFYTYRTLQDVLSVKLDTVTLSSIIEHLLIVFNDLLPEIKVDTWEIFGKYAVHAFPLIEQTEKLAVFNDKSWRICNDAGFYFKDISQYREAEELYLRAKTIAEDFYGSKHKNTAEIYNNLAFLYKIKGKYNEAEALYKKALEIRENVLGEYHPDTARIYNNLAELYRAQGKFEEAEFLHRRSLKIREKVLDQDDFDIAQSYNNLAVLYYSQERYEESESLYKKSLEIRERVLGKEHPDTGRIYNNLAELYRKQEKYEEAEPLYMKAMMISEKLLGENHSETATRYNNLALLYYEQGRYKDSEPFYRKSLAIREKVFGVNHPQTAQSYYNLAKLFDSQNKNNEAEFLYKKSLEVFEKVLKKNAPQTIESFNALSKFYFKVENLALAEKFQWKTLEARLATLGEHHLDVATSYSWFGHFCKQEKKHLEAVEYFYKAREIYLRFFTTKHPNVKELQNWIDDCEVLIKKE